MDGNKRIAFAAAYTFLAINRVDITADEDAVWRFLWALYEANEIAFDALEGWLRENTRPLRQLPTKLYP